MISADRRTAALGSYVSLFTSLGTLLCCALPSLFVLFGLGATLAAFLSAAPWLVSLSHYKHLVFAISGILIATNLFYIHWLAPRLRVQSGACTPDDPDACNAASKFSRTILWISLVIYLIGFFTAYVLGPILARFD